MRLASLRSCGVLDTPPDPAYDQLVFRAAQALRVPIAMLSFVDSDRLWLKARIGFPLAQIPRDDTFCSAMILESALLVVQDTAADPRFAASRYVTGPPMVRFYAGAAVLSPDGFPVGVLSALDTQPRLVSGAQLADLSALAREAGDMLRHDASKPPAYQ
jgi:GAF domain-containing protein